MNREYILDPSPIIFEEYVNYKKYDQINLKSGVKILSVVDP